MGKLLGKSTKQQIFVGIILLLATIAGQIIGWGISRQFYKNDELKAKQIELIDRFSQNLQDYQYLSQFSQTQVVLKFNLTGSVVDSLSAPSVVYMDHEERMVIQTMLKEKYPVVYDKALEADLAATKLFSTLNLIDLIYKDENIQATTQNLRDIIPPDKIFTKFFRARIKKDTSKIGDDELQNFKENYEKSLLREMQILLTLMAYEYEN